MHCRRIPLLLYVVGLIALPAERTSYAQTPSAPCNPRLTPQAGPKGYRDRGTHCEGFYERLVAPGSLRPVSLVLSEPPLQAKRYVLSWPASSAPDGVAVQAVAFKQGTLYRMDKVTKESSFDWTTEDLQSLALRDGELGVIATAEASVRGEVQRVYLPVSFAGVTPVVKPGAGPPPKAKDPAVTYMLRMASVEDLSEVYVSLFGPIRKDAPATEALAEVFADQPLGRPYYSSAAPLLIPLKITTAPGIYQVRVAGTRMNRPGSTTSTFYLQHGQ